MSSGRIRLGDIMKINIDRDMLLLELYEIRALLTEASIVSEEAKQAKKKLDEVVTVITSSPASENNQSFPRISLRR